MIGPLIVTCPASLQPKLTSGLLRCARKTPKYITAFPYVGEPMVILGNSSQRSLKTTGVLSFQRASLEKTRATLCLCRHALFRAGAQGPAVHPHPTSPAPLSPLPSAHSLAPFSAQHSCSRPSPLQTGLTSSLLLACAAQTHV